MRVTVVARDFAKLYALDCSPDEVGELEQLDWERIADLANVLRYEVGATISGARVRVLCFGREAKPQLAPPSIGRDLRVGRTALWYSTLRVAITTFRDGDPIQGQILHELTHGFLDELSNQFPYPYAVDEGFARLMSDWDRPVLPVAVDLSWGPDGRKAPERYLDDSQFVRVRDLLEFRPDFRETEDEDGVASYFAEITRMSTASYWLVAYLTLLGRDRPIVRRILRELRAKNVRSPGAVYEWLLHVSGTTPAELENGFYLYCTRGRSP